MSELKTGTTSGTKHTSIFYHISLNLRVFIPIINIATKYKHSMFNSKKEIFQIITIDLTYEYLKNYNIVL